MSFAKLNKPRQAFLIIQEIIKKKGKKGTAKICPLCSYLLHFHMSGI